MRDPFNPLSLGEWRSFQIQIKQLWNEPAEKIECKCRKLDGPSAFLVASLAVANQTTTSLECAAHYMGSPLLFSSR